GLVADLRMVDRGNLAALLQQIPLLLVQQLEQRGEHRHSAARLQIFVPGLEGLIAGETPHFVGTREGGQGDGWARPPRICQRLRAESANSGKLDTSARLDQATGDAPDVGWWDNRHEASTPCVG